MQKLFFSKNEKKKKNLHQPNAHAPAGEAVSIDSVQQGLGDHLEQTIGLLKSEEVKWKLRHKRRKRGEVRCRHVEVKVNCDLSLPNNDLSMDSLRFLNAVMLGHCTDLNVLGMVRSFIVI